MALGCTPGIIPADDEAGARRIGAKAGDPSCICSSPRIQTEGCTIHGLQFEVRPAIYLGLGNAGVSGGKKKAGPDPFARGPQSLPAVFPIVPDGAARGPGEIINVRG